MSEIQPPSEFLVISRGKWDPAIPPEEIQKAIDAFYVWIEQAVAEGKMRLGSRLSTGGKTVSRNAPPTDGPYGESKEVIGGFWFIIAGSLDEAAALASQNPCMQCGLFYEIRPLEPVCATAAAVTNETPSAFISKA